MTSKTIGFDIDGVVFEDYLGEWVDWSMDGQDFKEKIKLYEEIKESDTYRVYPIFESYDVESPGDFWDIDDLYKHSEVHFKCNKLINDLVSAGNKVIFISKCRPSHFKSKYNRLKELYPDIPFISTDEKHLIDVDCMIDDNPETLQEFKDTKRYTKLFLYAGVLKNIKPPEGEYVYNDWDAIREELKLYEYFGKEV